MRCQYRYGPIDPCMNWAIDGRNLVMPDGGYLIVMFCSQHRAYVEAWARKFREDALVVDPSRVFHDDEH